MFRCSETAFPREPSISPSSDPSLITVTDTEQGLGDRHTQKPILQQQLLRKEKAFIAELNHKETGGKAKSIFPQRILGLHLKEEAEKVVHIL